MLNQMSKIASYINKISNFRSLSLSESEELFQIMLNNGASQAQIAAIITSLKIKSESHLELLAYIRNLLEKSKFKAHLDINIVSTDIYNKRNLESLLLTSSLITSQAGLKTGKYLHKSLSHTSNILKFINGIGLNYRGLSYENSLSSFYDHHIGLFTTDCFKNLYNITENMEEINIRPLLSMIPNLCLPKMAKNTILLVKNSEQAELFAKVFFHFPDHKFWLIYNDFDYIGLLQTQPNHILEIHQNLRKQFILDINSYVFQPLAQSDIIYNFNHAREVFFGKKNNFYNLVILYTSLQFMITEGSDFKTALQKTESVISSGEVLNLISKLINLVNFKQMEKV